MQPRWRQDGAELFYLRSDQTIMAVPVKTGTAFNAGRPVALFRTRLLPQGSQSTWFDTAYDVTPGTTVPDDRPARGSRSADDRRARLARRAGEVMR